MSINEPSITVHGNLTGDPEVRFFQSGAGVAEFTVAQNPRFRQPDGNWTDGEPVFLTVKAWRELGENVADSLHKGDRVTVTGRLRRRTWQDDSGQKRYRDEVEADDVAISLRGQRVRGIAKAARGGADDDQDGAAK